MTIPNDVPSIEDTLARNVELAKYELSIHQSNQHH